MGEQESERSRRAQPQAVQRLSEEELARVLAQSVWTEQEAAAVLREQQRSGRSIALFAARHGISGSRLYYWRKRWPAWPVEAQQEPASAERPEPLAAHSTQAEKQELAPEALQRALTRELSPEAAGDRQVQQYVMRAVREEAKMWSMFALRASGSRLLCVVRWADSREPRPYSLAELDRTWPGLKWREFSTLQEAFQAFDTRVGSGGARPSSDAVPLLLPVQVRDAALLPWVDPAAEAGRPSPRAVTVDLPSGVRIRIPNGAEPELVRAVLGTTLGVRP